MVTAFGAGSRVASDPIRERTHYFTLGSLLVLFTYQIYHIATQTPRMRAGYSLMQKWAPLVLVFFGAIGMLLDQFRHLLLNLGMFEKQLAMYADFPNLSLAGRFCQVATVTGCISMLSGAFIFARVPEWVYGKFQEHL